MVDRLSVTEKQFGYAGVRDGRHTKAAHIKVNVEEGVRCRRLLLQGTRNHVLYLAQHHPKPKGNPGAKEGMWVPQRFLYGFYSDDLWAKTPQHFNPPASKAFHSRSTTLNRDRPTTVFSRKAFCACPSCAVPRCDFQNRLAKGVTGPVSTVKCQPVAPVCGALTPVMSLTEFSESLKVGEYYAVYAAEDEQHLEGPFWLARITEAMTTADEDYVYAGKSTSHCHVCVYASADAPSGI
jgi:hypothetical protein